MLILKYFLTVGAVLTAGLFALHAHMVTSVPATSAVMRTATSTSLATVPPKVQPVEEAPAVQPAPPPAAKSSTTKRSKHSARDQHRSR
jgi:hypothetical protein